jgi:hypothetical protein
MGQSWILKRLSKRSKNGQFVVSHKKFTLWANSSNSHIEYFLMYKAVSELKWD